MVERSRDAFDATVILCVGGVLCVCVWIVLWKLKKSNWKLVFSVHCRCRINQIQFSHALHVHIIYNWIELLLMLAIEYCIAINRFCLSVEAEKYSETKGRKGHWVDWHFSFNIQYIQYIHISIQRWILKLCHFDESLRASYDLADFHFPIKW